MQCNHVPVKLSGLKQALANQVSTVNEWTLQQLCDWVQTEHGIRAGVSAMWKTLARRGLSLKKVTSCQRANAPVRSTGKSGMDGQPDTPASRLVFLDEI